jgi:hypothetical protein
MADGDFGLTRPTLHLKASKIRNNRTFFGDFQLIGEKRFIFLLFPA